MPPTNHAKLSPSAADRWLQCPASIRMEASLPPEERDEDSFFAREGTAAHALAELYAAEEFGIMDPDERKEVRAAWRKEFSEFVDDLPTMGEHVNSYTDMLREHAQNLGDYFQVLLEQRLRIEGVKNCFGTSDAVLVGSDAIEICDFKYGRGVQVDAPGNPQLRLYALGALDAFDGLLGKVSTVRMTIFQPRIHHVSVDEMTAEELRAWRKDVVIPAAVSALGPDAPFGPSESACRWCPASGRCRAQVQAFALKEFDELDPELLSPRELGEFLDRATALENLISAARKKSLEMIYNQGLHVDGWKVVKSGGRRFIADEDGIIKRLVDAGFEQSDVSDRKPKTLGKLESLVGKQQFDEIAGEFVSKHPGKPSLVPESDRRQALSSVVEAAKELML